jgi:hypothetical protein
MRTAFGYEKDNGKVAYVLCHELLFDEIYTKYLVNRSVPGAGISIEAPTIEMYFGNEKEMTTWRILYKLDGNIICRRDRDFDVSVRKGSAFV